MKNFISAKWLKENLENNNLVIVDCRSDLLNNSYGKQAYEKHHIKGAVFVDLKTQLSSIEKDHGGRNPLPSVKDFKVTLENLGIDQNTIVVAYDEMKIASAARFCWMLRCMGHKKNYILDGGIQQWINEGYELNKNIIEKEKKHFDILLNEEIKTDAFGVKTAQSKKNSYIIDSRTEVRYRGESEPIDKIAGHIEGAENYYWKKNLNEDGKIKNITFLKERFRKAVGRDEVIVYCGSGIDAAFNFMILDEIGIKSKLYIGSWSDWITYNH